MATVGYASALGSIAKDAISGAGKGFVGGLKGAMMTEAPGITGAYAFGKELRNRANAPRVAAGGKYLVVVEVVEVVQAEVMEETMEVYLAE